MWCDFYYLWKLYNMNYKNVVQELTNRIIGHVRNREPTQYRTRAIQNPRNTEPTQYRTHAIQNPRNTEPTQYRTHAIQNPRNTERNTEPTQYRTHTIQNPRLHEYLSSCRPISMPQWSWSQDCYLLHRWSAIAWSTLLRVLHLRLLSKLCSRGRGVCI